MLLALTSPSAGLSPRRPISVNLTSMTSASVVCTVRPTNVASTGSSRCPRSIKHQQLHEARAAVGEEGIERGARGAAGVKNIVDQDDLLMLRWRKPISALLDDGLGSQGGKVVAIERDVEGAHGNFLLLDLLNHLGRGARRWELRGGVFRRGRGPRRHHSSRGFRAPSAPKCARSLNPTSAALFAVSARLMGTAFFLIVMVRVPHRSQSALVVAIAMLISSLSLGARTYCTAAPVATAAPLGCTSEFLRCDFRRPHRIRLLRSPFQLESGKRPVRDLDLVSEVRL
jgi:hypothetical protein